MDGQTDGWRHGIFLLDGNGWLILGDLPGLSVQILEIARDYGSVTIREATKATGTSRNTVKDHIKSLTENGRLARHSAGRGTWYSLASFRQSVLGGQIVHRIHSVTVQDSPMEIFMFEPEGNGPHPGLVLAQHLPVGHTGLENDEVTLKTAERFAENGYVVAVPFIFHWWPKEEDIQIKRDEFRDDWTAQDLKVTYDYLAAQENVDRAHIGIVGHCWGGRVAWLGACHNPDYMACGIFYGGRIKLQMGPGTPPTIELAGNIKCPVAGFFGNQDEGPSPQDVDDYDAALTAAGVPHVFYRYDGAGHGFQSFTNKDRYHPEASEDAWGKVLAFLTETLC